MRLATSPSRNARMIGNAARHARLEEQVPLVLQCGLEKLRAALGQQRLVRGDDVLAVLQRALDQLEGVGRAADQFDDDIEVGIRRPACASRRRRAPPARRFPSRVPARRTATWSTRISVPVRWRSRSSCEARRRSRRWRPPCRVRPGRREEQE